VQIIPFVVKKTPQDFDYRADFMWLLRSFEV